MMRDIVLRVLEPADAATVLELQLRNRSYWQATGPQRGESWFTLGAQRRRLEQKSQLRADGLGLFFGVVAHERLVGRIALSNIVRGPFLNAYLGYGIDERHAGRGIATAALQQAVDLAWADGLHRVQAAVSPDNAASKRVLEKVGFRREGLALRYLRLHGGWTDQELWAITVEDARPR
ncbi:MAG TPA: GNAT family protein [Solirubrobacteraceae bacterium]|jgi:ribosomal-protein-alanine N-acetyltransferase|nr:GNAT family protein [Solirubrobacteraceae bacterium]